MGHQFSFSSPLLTFLDYQMGPGEVLLILSPYCKETWIIIQLWLQQCYHATRSNPGLGTQTWELLSEPVFLPTPPLQAAGRVLLSATEMPICRRVASYLELVIQTRCKCCVSMRVCGSCNPALTPAVPGPAERGRPSHGWAGAGAGGEALCPAHVGGRWFLLGQGDIAMLPPLLMTAKLLPEQELCPLRAQW